MTTAELRSLFEQFGVIENINILYEKNCVFIDYFEERAAVEAQRQMKGITIGGNLIELGFGKYEEKPTVGFLVQLTSNPPIYFLVLGFILRSGECGLVLSVDLCVAERAASSIG